MVSTSVTLSSVDKCSEEVCDTATINDSGLHQSGDLLILLTEMLAPGIILLLQCTQPNADVCNPRGTCGCVLNAYLGSSTPLVVVLESDLPENTCLMSETWTLSAQL